MGGVEGEDGYFRSGVWDRGTVVQLLGARDFVHGSQSVCGVSEYQSGGIDPSKTYLSSNRPMPAIHLGEK